MATTAQTGISAAPSASVMNPQVTFVWSASVNVGTEGNTLTVTAGAGGFGDPPNNFQNVSSPIPWGDTGWYAMTASTNPLIGVTGSVSVVWGDSDSYIVLFSGHMLLNASGNLMDVASSNQAPSASSPDSIIVYAYVA